MFDIFVLMMMMEEKEEEEEEEEEGTSTEPELIAMPSSLWRQHCLRKLWQGKRPGGATKHLSTNILGQGGGGEHDL